MKSGNSVLSEYRTTIFEVMSRLARETQAINLGQGFPDSGEPTEVVEAAARALTDRSNQYPPMLGIPELRQAVATHDKEWYGLDLDWQTETMVACGATECLAAAIFAMVEPGDEVVVVEPLYDSYLPIIRRAGGVPKLVRLEAPDWALPEDKLRAAFGPKTKLILFNSPMNPTAKMFSKAELELIAELVSEHDAYALCDEVYEHLAFDGPHIPLITLPGMRDRAIRVQSAGKTFSLTGWKVGYISAAPALVDRIARAHQFLTFTTAPNLQAAVAVGLMQERAAFERFTAGLEAKRDRLSAGLERVGFKPLRTQGTYFLNVDIGDVGATDGDESFCKRLTSEAGVAAIPVSAFYASDGPTNLARFCFAKRDEVLDQAIERLERYFRR